VCWFSIIHEKLMQLQEVLKDCRGAGQIEQIVFLKQRALPKVKESRSVNWRNGPLAVHEQPSLVDHLAHATQPTNWRRSSTTSALPESPKG